MHPAKLNSPLLRANNAVLVVVDMQEPFLRSLFERERVVRNVCMLLDGAKALQLPVIATTQYAERMGGVIPEVQERLGDAPVLDKMTFSCWDEPFRQEIERTGRKQALLCHSGPVRSPTGRLRQCDSSDLSTLVSFKTSSRAA
jgi:hypothetical protein